MSSEIQGEIFFFLVCASAGVLLLFGYDLLRAVRRVFPHGNLLLAVEDFLYWSAAGILAFGVIFLKNSGVVRGFSLCAIVLGMGLYHKSVSPLILKAVSAGLGLFATILSKIVGIVYSPLKIFTGKVCGKPKKTLKKRIKKVKMTLFKKGEEINKEGHFI